MLGRGMGMGMVNSEGMELGFGMRLVFLPPFIPRETSELGQRKRMNEGDTEAQL